VEAVLHFLDFMKPHWYTLALVLTWVGIGMVALRRRLHWRRKQFLNQVNFSLNYVKGDTLAMRTLLETTAQNVWLNEYGVKMVFAAAQKTTVDNPFIQLDDPTDQDFIHRAVLNVLSEKFAPSFLAEALGREVRHSNFCFAITFERYAEIRTLKLRVLIVEESALTGLFGAEAGAAKLQVSGPLKARMKTLKALAEMHQHDKAAEKKALGYMEMGVYP
jgi:hypothetical protein